MDTEAFHNGHSQNGVSTPDHATGASGQYPAIDGQVGGDLAQQRPELVILQGLRRIMRAVELHSKKLASTFGVTGPQLVCLAVLGEEGAMSQKQLGARVSLGASTITGIVDRLEARGLVERTRDSRDRRRMLVALTEKGERVYRRAPSPLQDTLAEKLEALPWLEQVNVAMSVQRLVDMMEAHEIDASPMLITGDIAADVPKSGSITRSPKDHA